jgi:putative ABC transport system substrate-binding protein
VNRRRTLAVLLALAAPTLPSPGHGRTAARSKPFRIGVIPDMLPGRRKLIVAALRSVGWTVGADYVLVESGIPMGFEIERSIRRVVDAQPDLILASVTGYVLVARRLTRTIPIVMWTSGYPVEAGLAQSLARPGGNVTGLAIYAGTEVFGKLLELLREVKPDVRRVGVLWAYVPPFHPREEIEPCYRELREAAQRLGLELRLWEVERPERASAVMGAVAAENVHALLLTSGAPTVAYRAEITKYAIRARLPTISDFTWPGIEPQPLLRYSPSAAVLLGQAAAYIDRILSGGASAGELPIQRPASFELELNMRTARAIGLEVPRSILLRADRVIE